MVFGELLRQQEKRTPIMLGGYVNAYNIARELWACGHKNIGVVDYRRQWIARVSRRTQYLGEIDGTPASLLKKLELARDRFGKLVVFSTDDRHLMHLAEINSQIEDYCFVPANLNNLAEALSKKVQYTKAKSLGIPVPESLTLEANSLLLDAPPLQLPMLIKWQKQTPSQTHNFRNALIQTVQEWISFKEKLAILISDGGDLVASEFIPGAESNIYSYACVRSSGGQILNEWTGRKLSQFPDYGGVFASASNGGPRIVADYGRQLVSELDGFGFCQPEFKFDERDGKYKLMEVNLRSMMWHRVGFLSGVNLHETIMEWASSGEASVTKQSQSAGEVTLSLAVHEIPNLIARPGYWTVFKSIFFSGRRVNWAIFDRSDPLPMVFGFIFLFKRTLAACLRRLKIR